MEKQLSFLFMMMTIYVVPVSSILHPNDFLALQSIRKSLADLPGSTFFSDWDFTADPCAFSGVLCSPQSTPSTPRRVISLSLGDPRASSPGLSGRLSPLPLPPPLPPLLSVVPGRLVGPLPLPLLPPPPPLPRRLPQLPLRPHPPQIGQIPTLQTLDLSFNQFTGPIPQSIQTLSQLSNLILSHNHLSGSIPNLSNSKTLLRINLQHNNLSGSLTRFTLPSALQHLSLSSNRITGSLDRVLDRLDRISYLDLSMNRFTGTVPSCVFGFKADTLLLQRNGFSGPVRPVRPVEAQTVDLSFNALTGQVSEMFSTVENLYLNNNGFEGEVPGALVDRVLTGEIKLLYLQHNYLTGIQIDPTAAIPESSSMCLMYNCMVPPVETPCPRRAGKQKVRPWKQCNEGRRRKGKKGK
ncbi:hypothetical protein Sjap_006708 [Stephania japonica]|uniref:Leucine-rich repeat-containing N-terminal plant-type domain-containing protein n=1 Tax=Stephania japonica TaxID=461633 RepID=A0AAP0K8Y2_9MAGN